MPGTKPRHLAARQGYDDYVWQAPGWTHMLVMDGAESQAHSDAFRAAWVACTTDAERDAVLTQFRAHMEPLHARQGTYVGS